ncbi:hypothetical protein ACQKRQ_38270 [Paraburkholderia sp. NPDC080076]|uniref:hypothetical protein n=1 Tax=Paraburkholderia sp. NPDC080076 TaxID=3390605 RepID=UPI003CFEC843
MLMEFISLHAVLMAVSRSVNPKVIFSDEPFPQRWQIREAARNLLQVLTNETAGRPRWVEMDSQIGRYMASEAVAVQGQRLLRKAAIATAEEEWLECWMHAMKQKGPMMFLGGSHANANDPWSKKEYARTFRIGFFHTEVVRFLEATEITFRFDNSRQDALSDNKAEAGKANGQVTGLSKHEIAAAFENIRWSKEQWIERLGKAKGIPWLFAARLTGGRRGGEAATFDPVAIALGLRSRRKGDVGWLTLDILFSRPEMSLWQERWKEAKAKWKSPNLR